MFTAIFEGSILCVWSGRGCAAASAAAPAPLPPPPPHAPSGSLHPAAPYLPPLPCVRPSRCSRAASTSFTLRHQAPGESQPPLGRQITGVRPPPQPARRSCCCASLPAAAHTASSRTFLRRFIQESRRPMRLLGRGEEARDRPTRNTPSLINAFFRGGEEGQGEDGAANTVV